MMYRKLIPLSALLLALTPGMAAAIEIGTVRAQELVQKSPQYEKAEARMRSDFESRASELQEEAQQLQEDIQTFQQEADLMSAEDRTQKEQELSTRQNDFQLKQRRFREDVSNRERELYQEMMGKIRDEIEDVARERGLDLIVPDPVYAAPELDLTDAVLKKLQQSDD
ncbi:OmpH family outer membrane protein [Algiphilus sp.]|uniref:OmpH family outer membrane protein n=1 Tax=Algiphilus sp. TaxID=1872431 RepID=UPI0025C23AE3|nr:OmpH family outer membrane protein [Algiphilus sp.]MCK5771895.1 OmpH family outer membrane protein [Algiphilus sp.]